MDQIKKCKNPNCRKEFVTNSPRKKYCSQNCCVAHLDMRKKKFDREDAKYLTWRGMKIRNGCFAKLMIYDW